MGRTIVNFNKISTKKTLKTRETLTDEIKAQLLDSYCFAAKETLFIWVDDIEQYKVIGNREDIFSGIETWSEMNDEEVIDFLIYRNDEGELAYYPMIACDYEININVKIP